MSETPATPPADSSRFALFLLAGQSNMSGRGELTETDRIGDPRILVLNAAGHWVVRGEPFHYDKPEMVGVGPGSTFARLLAAVGPELTIGLIPCAFGGTSLEQWDPASTQRDLYPPRSLYENAIYRTMMAQASGSLRGILWHQGEANAWSVDATNSMGTYGERLARFVTRLRADLGAPEVPFIAGEVGHFCYEPHPGMITINRQINLLPDLVPACAVVSADGLGDKGDQLHFSGAAQREFGRRYFDAWFKVTCDQAEAARAETAMMTAVSVQRFSGI